MIGQQFLVKKIGAKVEVEAPRIKLIDREYIKSISSRAMDEIDNLNFDSAITSHEHCWKKLFAM